MDSSEDMTETKRQRQREHAKRSYYKRVVRFLLCGVSVIDMVVWRFMHAFWWRLAFL